MTYSLGFCSTWSFSCCDGETSFDDSKSGKTRLNDKKPNNRLKKTQLVYNGRQTTFLVSLS